MLIDRSIKYCESEKEDNEATITDCSSAAKKLLWHASDADTNWEGLVIFFYLKSACFDATIVLQSEQGSSMMLI